MKKTVQSLIILLVVTAACNTTPNPKIKTVETEAPKEMASGVELSNIELTVEGMTCQIGCAAAIEKKLNAVDGVQSATVDFITKTARVSFDASLVNSDTLTNAISSAGKSYSVSNVNLVSEFSSLKSCKKDCSKPCCNKEGEEKASCQKDCSKPCCKQEKSACHKECKKACCTKKEVV